MNLQGVAIWWQYDNENNNDYANNNDDENNFDDDNGDNEIIMIIALQPNGLAASGNMMTTQ